MIILHPCTIASTEANLSYYCPYNHACEPGYDVCWCTDEANGAWQYGSKKWDSSCGCYKWYACKMVDNSQSETRNAKDGCRSGWSQDGSAYCQSGYTSVDSTYCYKYQ